MDLTDSQIVRCAQENQRKIENAQEVLEDLFDLEGTDTRLIPWVTEYLEDFRRQTLRIQLNAELRLTQARLNSL